MMRVRNLLLLALSVIAIASCNDGGSLKFNNQQGPTNPNGDNHAKLPNNGGGPNCTNEGYKLCGTECVYLNANPEHCGDCDQAVGDGKACIKGEAIVPDLTKGEVPKKDGTCEPGRLYCDGYCVNPKTSDQHCGSCGNSADANSRCVNGKIVSCGDDKILCNGECVDKEGNNVCRNGQIVACSSPQLSCSNECVDIKTNAQHCGACGNACGDYMVCDEGKECVCEPFRHNCDGDLSNGCESPAPCCKAGELCIYKKDIDPSVIYADDPDPKVDAAAKKITACRLGTAICNGSKIASCDGEVKYHSLKGLTGNDLDEDRNCNGIIDKDEDLDGDGFTKGQGDTCDDERQCEVATNGDYNGEPIDPKTVNPGAYDIPGDGIDNDLDGTVDIPKCELSNSSDPAMKMAEAMEICTSRGNYGLLSDTSASIDLSGGSCKAEQYAVVDKFTGTYSGQQVELHPQVAPNVAVISSGKAAPTNSDANFRCTLGGNVPEPYKTVHGGNLQSHSDCPINANINDRAKFKLDLKAPTNATGFEFQFRFFSVEYPRFVCSQYNDFFLALVKFKDGKNPNNWPADGNVSFDKEKNPISVNNAFFTSCEPIKCTLLNQCKHDSIVHKNMKCDTTDPKRVCKFKKADGTLFEPCEDGEQGRKDVAAVYPNNHGGSAWLTSTVPVNPGQEFTIEFYIWDTGDQDLDSKVLLDGFKWRYDQTSLDTIKTPAG